MTQFTYSGPIGGDTKAILQSKFLFQSILNQANLIFSIQTNSTTGTNVCRFLREGTGRYGVVPGKDDREFRRV